jgi:hypothetical protein
MKFQVLTILFAISITGNLIFKGFSVLYLLLSFYKLATNGLTCLDCNENNRNCRGLVVQYGTIGIEPCSTRCFIRRARDLGNSKFTFINFEFFF